LSSDYRFDDQWIYGQPETCEKNIINQKRIANPGCYATASQLGLLPIIEYCDTVPSIFGVSGYSGAGSKPSENNDPQRLAHNLKAYKLNDHIHEREVTKVLGKSVYFMPHVAEFFRGIHLTISVELNKALTLQQIQKCYQQYYRDFALIQVLNEIPEIQKVQNTHNVSIGGFNLKDRHLVLCVCLDNLLKGAATQAVQNMNLALSNTFNLSINTGITHDK
jgi:N-acetyl-gamma-glutamyl-phosphate reductase/acetylglutamate kinase